MNMVPADMVGQQPEIDEEEETDDAEAEALALCDERLMAEYLESGTLTETNLAAALARRAWFPCWFGAALRQEGIAELLEGLVSLTP